MKRRKTLGIIIDTALYIPPITGVTYRLYYLSKKLADTFNVKIFVCNRTIENQSDAKNLFDCSPIEFHVIPENIFYDVKKMHGLIKRECIDILQFEDSVSVIRYYKIARTLGIPICLEMHDVESTLKDNLGFVNNEIKKSKKFTHDACFLADVVVCMTPRDRKELINDIHIPKSMINIAPNPIDHRLFKYFGPNTSRFNIIFLGNMYYWPNKNAAKIIIKKIVSNVKKEIGRNVKFYFIGLVPLALKKRFKNYNVVFTGPVADLNKYIRRATIALCPVTEGSGMKVKILNYCAAGIPTITTGIGSSGYEKVKDLIIEDNLEKYAKIITDLLARKKEMIKIGKSLRNDLIKNYDIDKISKKMILIYRKILKNKKSNSALGKINYQIDKPLWLAEKRTSQKKNNLYYIIKNGEIIKKENTAQIDYS
jgi:glycosyltransferase involved in cell wall biosynthesis